MARKRNSPRFPKHTTPVHPSLSSNPSASKGHHHIPRSLHSTPPTTGNSVNDLIQRQRLSFASPTPKVTEPSLSRGSLVQAQTLPPSLHAILQRPAALLPDLRLPYPILGRSMNRRPAGPPPPSSWVQQENQAPQNEVMYSSVENDASSIYEVEYIYHPLDPLPGLSIPDEGSLQFQTLKSLALRWDWHLRYEWNNLAALPMKTRERILYFVAKYNHGMMTRAGLEALFLGDSRLEDLPVTENLTCLDLGTSLGSGCSLYDLMDIFVRKPYHASASKQEQDNSIIPDAWDAPEAVATMHRHLPSFSFLTHLSLAQPFKACWKALLRLAPHLATLTHLSLAYWPVPSFRQIPETEHPPGPFFYENKLMGNGLREGPKILRRLSRATYCLQWLDLTGCCGWLWALQCTDGPDWAGSWRQVQTVQAGLHQRPRFNIRSGVNISLDWVKLIEENDGSLRLMDFFEMSHWAWYVRSLRKLEALVNRLRMTSSTPPRVQEDDNTPYEEQIGNAEILDLSMRTGPIGRGTSEYTAIATDYKWWHIPTDGPIGAELYCRSKKRAQYDGRIVFESSPDEEEMLATMIDAYHARGKRLASVRFDIEDMV